MIQIAVFLCDHAHPKLIDHCGDYDEMFDDLFSVFRNRIQLTYFDVKNLVYPEKPEEFDGFIASGSSNSVYDEDHWIEVFHDYIIQLHSQRRRFVGVCFGHQMIGHALGGRVGLYKGGWGVGVKKDTILHEKSWLGGVKEYKLLFTHADQILELPENTEILAKNDHCRYAMILVDDVFLGIQGHPEFQRDYALGLMEERADRIPEAIRDKARPTFNEQPNNSKLAEIIIGFFEKGLS